ncbi:MAG: ATP-binding protein [Polyangiales bacterium]
MVFRTRADKLDSPVSASDAVKDAVETMVRQFADPLAFYRELVQNSIDAGASAINVRLRYDDEADALQVSVHDDGTGMNLETIERCLLVLFRSSKDKDPTKIGKFGVGFFSVFAVGPTVVRVDTGTGSDGYRVELKPDFTYEVTESSARKGTVVTLIVPMRQAEARSFVERSMAAIERWCPHVEVALHVLSTVRGGEIDKRADHPFGIEGSPSVMTRVPLATIAMTVAAEGRAAFYKRGILLYECPNSFFSGVTFKVEAPALVHTVSRDNVKRDSAFNQVISAVEGAIRRDLVGTVVTAARAALSEALAATSARRSDAQDAQKHAAKLMRAAFALGQQFALDVPLPLCDPEPGTSERVYLGPAAKIRYYASGPSVLTTALARKKTLVLDAHCLGESNADFLRSLVSSEATDAHERFVALAPRDGTLEPVEEDLLERTRKLLRAVDIPLVRAVEVSNSEANIVFLAVDEGELNGATRAGVVLDATSVYTPLYSFFSTKACAINRMHPIWRTALAAAENDAGFAALAFARLVLLRSGALTARRDRALFDRFSSVDVQ